MKRKREKRQEAISVEKGNIAQSSGLKHTKGTKEFFFYFHVFFRSLIRCQIRHRIS